jgi:hypothetical protein
MLLHVASVTKNFKVLGSLVVLVPVAVVNSEPAFRAIVTASVATTGPTNNPGRLSGR